MTSLNVKAAKDGDIWFRIVTHKDHIRCGRVHHSAWGGRAIAEPKPEKGRPWDRELSGRLRSLAGSVDDIVRAAELYCEQLKNRGSGNLALHGLIFVRVSQAKNKFEERIATAVYYTPLEHDNAHSDFTFTGWSIETREDQERFNLWLSGILEALHHPGQLQMLPEAEIG